MTSSQYVDLAYAKKTTAAHMRRGIGQFYATEVQWSKPSIIYTH